MSLPFIMQAHLKLAEHYHRKLMQLHDLYQERGSYFGESMRQFAMDYDQYMHMHKWLVINQNRDPKIKALCVGYVTAAPYLLSSQISPLEYEDWLETALRAERSQSPTHPETEGLLLTLLGDVSIIMGGYEDADQYLREAQSLVEAADNPTLRMELTNAQQRLAIRQGKLSTVLDKELPQTADNSETFGHYFNLATAHMLKYNHKEALKSFEIVLPIARQNEDYYNICGILAMMAQVYRNMGRYAEARPLFDEALALARQYELHEVTAISLNGIGTLHFFQKDYALALSFFHQALEIYQQYNFQRGTANTYQDIANVYMMLNQVDEGIKYLHKARAMFVVMNVPHDVASIDLLLEQMSPYRRALRTIFSPITILSPILDPILGNPILKLRLWWRQERERNNYE